MFKYINNNVRTIMCFCCFLIKTVLFIFNDYIYMINLKIKNILLKLVCVKLHKQYNNNYKNNTNKLQLFLK